MDLPILFTKMSGTGNDFIIIDHRQPFLGEDALAGFTRAVCRRKFSVGADGLILIENSDKASIGDFAVWQMDTLRKRLIEKHNETFWVAAESLMINQTEHFQFKKILHTRKPISSQFDLLLDQGEITMDHLIKRNSKGRVSEKGPLFKIKESSLEMLFPPSKTYDLSLS